MNKQPTIVVVAYNRAYALQGLLDSLAQADYPNEQVRLVISIDHSGSDEVSRLAESFQWEHGEKRIIQHEQRLGLYQHVLSCGDLSDEYGPVIILEDDLVVSPGFYKYAQGVLSCYGNSELLGGFSLYSYRLAETSLKPMYRVADDLPVYLLRFPSSWGQMYTTKQWKAFKTWLSNDDKTPVDLPPFVRSWSAGSWKKDYLRYIIHQKKYFLFPKESYTSNMGYKGTNFTIDLNIFQVPLASSYQPINFPAIDDITPYDEYFEVDAAELSQMLDQPIDVVDIYGSKPLFGDITLKVLTSKQPVDQQVAGTSIDDKTWEIAPLMDNLYINKADRFMRNIPVPKVEDAALANALSNGDIADDLLSRQRFLLSYKFMNYLNIIRRKLGM